MSAPLSNELFFNVHRGLSKVTKADTPLGRHWSARYIVASDFATTVKGTRVEAPGVVVSAKVPMSSVETNSETIEKARQGNFPEEHEVTVKSGSPVYVTHLRKITPRRLETTFGKEGIEVKERRGRIRTRTYNPPREMQA